MQTTSHITPKQLLIFQIALYTDRLSQARTTAERSFLRSELHNFKKKKNEQRKGNITISK